MAIHWQARIAAAGLVAAALLSLCACGGSTGPGRPMALPSPLPSPTVAMRVDQGCDFLRPRHVPVAPAWSDVYRTCENADQTAVSVTNLSPAVLLVQPGENDPSLRLGEPETGDLASLAAGAAIAATPAPSGVLVLPGDSVTATSGTFAPVNVLVSVDRATTSSSLIVGGLVDFVQNRLHLLNPGQELMGSIEACGSQAQGLWNDGYPSSQPQFENFLQYSVRTYVPCRHAWTTIAGLSHETAGGAPRPAGTRWRPVANSPDRPVTSAGASSRGSLNSCPTRPCGRCSSAASAQRLALAVTRPQSCPRSVPRSS